MQPCPPCQPRPKQITDHIRPPFCPSATNSRSLQYPISPLITTTTPKPSHHCFDFGGLQVELPMEASSRRSHKYRTRVLDTHDVPGQSRKYISRRCDLRRPNTRPGWDAFMPSTVGFCGCTWLLWKSRTLQSHGTHPSSRPGFPLAPSLSIVQ